MTTHRNHRRHRRNIPPMTKLLLFLAAATVAHYVIWTVKGDQP